MLDRAKPGVIAVNKTGRRFVNEAVSYHDFVLAMFEANARAPSIPCYLICDAAFIETYGLGIVYPGMRDLSALLKSGYLKRGATLEELAALIGVDAPALRATVTRYNAFAQTGADVDFGKGETELNRFNGDESHTPNPCIGPIARAPYYAVELWPAEIAVSTGLSTDADARVLDRDLSAIPGLYACGNDMASPMSGAYPGPGTTLGPGMVFAYRAAMHAAGKTRCRCYNAISRGRETGEGIKMRKAFLQVLCLITSLTLGADCRADGVADFYKGKTIMLSVGYTAGGGYDALARITARHMSRYIPGNPNIVVVNEPGAGTLMLANRLYNVAPRDGTQFGIIARGMAIEPLIGTSNVLFDPSKFTWLGSAANEVSLCVTYGGAAVKTWQDALTTPFTVGGAGTGSDPDVFANVLRNLFGVKDRLVTGYPGTPELSLAMERGEIDGRCGWSWASIKWEKSDWVAAEQAQCPRANGLCQSAGPAARAADHRRGAKRGAAADLEARLQPAGHGTAVRRTARPSGGS